MFQSNLNIAENSKVKSILKKRKNKIDHLLGDNVRDYFKNTTIHGLKYVGDTSLSIIERFYWIFLGLAKNNHRSFSDYFSLQCLLLLLR